MTNEKPKPADRVNCFPVGAAIWRNVTDDGQAFYSFTLERSYKKEDGEYDSTSSFNAGDALLLAKVADIVDTRIRTLRDADRKAEQTANNLNRDVA